MIKIENGIYRQGDFTLRASFEIPVRQFCAVLGPSGAGKSTLLNIIAGFEDLNAGRLNIDGQDMTTAPPAARPISMVFQDHNVFAHLNVWANVALGVNPNLKLSELEDKSVSSALARVGLTELAKKLPGEISGGERQRVALARVLVRKAKILLLDEPFAALDPGLRKDMLQLVQTITIERGLTTLLVTHQPDEAKQVAQRVIFISNGIVGKPLKTDSFFNEKDSAVRNYLGQQN